MTATGSAASPHENPFSTRYTRPGALAYLFPAASPAEVTPDTAESSDAPLDALVAQFQRQRRRGQIIGPHGSGKSTLLAALLPRLALGGTQVVHLELHDGQRWLPPGALSRIGASPAVIVVDGYEQLAWWSRILLRATCHRHRWGLLVTAHADVGLPTLFRTATSERLASQIVSKLLQADTSRIHPQDVQTTFTAAAGDLREMLFALYDLYEERQPR